MCCVLTSPEIAGPGGETGRRTGLKIPGPERGVSVRFRPRAPSLRCCGVFGESAAVSRLASQIGARQTIHLDTHANYIWPVEPGSSFCTPVASQNGKNEMPLAGPNRL